MKLSGRPWKTVWHDRQVSDKFFQELSKLEKGMVKGMGSSGQWLEQVVIELGQLAQNMVQLEGEDPHTPQIRLAFERAIKLSALAAHLALALHEAEGDRQPTPYHPSVASAVEAATQQAKAAGMAEAAEQQPESPMRRTIRSLADRGVPVAEIEIITGHPRHIIEAILSEG